MQCEQMRDEVLARLPRGEGVPWPEASAQHLEDCGGCRAEANALNRTWTRLGQWPETSPAAEIRPRLIRAVRRQLLRESVLTVRGWVPAVLAAGIGVGLSLGLSLLVPYPLLVSLCGQALQVFESDASPYLMAGAVYGVPLALGVSLVRRPARGPAVVGSLQASMLFLLILSPYVAAQCGGFAPALQAAFFSGLAGGALASSFGGSWLARLAPFGTF